MRSIFVRAAAIAALATAIPAMASAQNLVTNGGFETGNFSGWTLGGCQDHASVTTGAAHSGSYGGYFGQVNSCYGTYTQTLATTPGQTYSISLFALPSGGSNGFQVYFDGNTLFNQTLTNSTWQQLTFTGTATSTSTAFGFGVYNNPSYTNVDDISVTANMSTVPEPSSMALLGTGLAGLVPLVRRRK